jgi:hypothetical protein
MAGRIFGMGRSSARKKIKPGRERSVHVGGRVAIEISGTDSGDRAPLTKFLDEIKQKTAEGGNSSAIRSRRVSPGGVFLPHGIAAVEWQAALAAVHRVFARAIPAGRSCKTGRAADHRSVI